MGEQVALKWYEKTGQGGDVAVSTRVRLARNLRREVFPGRASAEQKVRVARQVRDALLDGNSVLAGSFRFLPLEELSPGAAASLAERHLISPAFAAGGPGRAVLVSEDESICVMVNEEDHVRIQVLREGLALEEAAEAADRMDTLLGERLEFAYDRAFGYLTQCPTNLGTGMRASLMLHLPGLAEAGSLPRLAANLSKLGLTLRGAFGEGSRAVGEMVQLSNQITLGLSENQAIENLAAIAGQLMGEERRIRAGIEKDPAWQDKICRAAGILRSARLMSAGEAAQLLSLARLGVALGLLEGMEPGEIDGLLVKVQPATLAEGAGKPLDEAQRDARRAGLLRAACRGLEAAYAYLPDRSDRNNGRDGPARRL